MKSVLIFLLVCASQSAQALKPASKEELAELDAIFVTIADTSKKIAKNRVLHRGASTKEKAVLDQKLVSLMKERETPCRAK